MNDNILIYQQKRTDRLISCLVADGMVRAALIDGLAHSGIGHSWGGFQSLALPIAPARYRSATVWQAQGPAIRLHIGLEGSADLIADLAAVLGRFRAVRDGA